MMTISGVIVEPDFDLAAPTMYDIGYSLSRMERFGGHTRTSYTVLQHLFAAAELARLLEYSTRIQLLALLHDAHESVTGDIPRHWKTKDMSAQQDLIDERIFKSLGILAPSPEEHRLIKQIDDALLSVEAPSIGPVSGKVEPGLPAIAFVFSQADDFVLGPHKSGLLFNETVEELLGRLETVTMSQMSEAPSFDPQV